MLTRNAPSFGFLLVVGLGLAAAAGACGSSGNSASGSPDGGGEASTPSDASTNGDGPTLFGDAANDAIAPLAISPANMKLVVPYGASSPTVTFTAAAGGAPVPASFSIDLGQIGGIDAATGVLTPSGKIGGTAHVTAVFRGQKVSTSVIVTIEMSDNGAPPGSDAGAGVGGNGGVGGSGPGGPVPTGGQTVLTGAPAADAGLAWLYPYDKTVWPQGLLAPLLQWQKGAVGTASDYDAVYIHLQETGFEYKGFFTAPASPFINHPVPQAAWDTMSYSNQGEPVAVTLVLSSGGKAYGPLTETWKIAQGTLTGTVYYNSYGTSLVTNYCDVASWMGGAQYCFGGATLSITHGATSPVLVAGINSPPGDNSGCRVCHSVAAQGGTLITQHGDNYAASSAYALTAGNTETPMMPADGTFAFPAISPDGTYLFTDVAPLAVTTPPTTSGLFAVPSGAPLTTTGLPAGLGAATPAFSPDSQHLAFNNYTGDKASLVAMDFAPSTNAFSNFQTIDTPPSGTDDVYPAFLPTNDAVIFEREVGGGGFNGSTGVQAELWWADLKTHTPARLTTLNGGSYLPMGPNNHSTDTILQYQPTVNPVASGGYAWVVFTSRRLYGNVATQDPFLSDPRSYDPSQSATTKKLWVAAIDLNASPGSDPSHPAFYLPGQELLAGNSRGYWVVDPCEQNGQSCLTGDQCCSGYCGASGDAGLVCGTQPPGCAAVSNKCKVSSDCCGSSTGIECVDGFCSQPTPQ